MAADTRTCPGCGLRMPVADGPVHRYYHGSPECWAVFGEVTARQYDAPVIRRRVGQTTTDAYAAQHPGGSHPDKSVVIHLVGLHLVLDRGISGPAASGLLQRLGDPEDGWPHLEPPAERHAMTVFDVARADSPYALADLVQQWAGTVWQVWTPHHAVIDAFAERYVLR